MAAEAKEVTNLSLRQESESVIDKALDGLGAAKSEKETAEEETSTSEKTVEEKTETSEKSEDTTSKKSADKKEAETEIPKEFHKHPAWQRIMQRANNAEQELAEIRKTSLTKEEADNFRKVISSPEFIRVSMKSQGFTDEAINKRLRGMGHEAEVLEEDDFEVVKRLLKINEANLTDEQKQYVNTQVYDAVKIAGLLFDYKLNKMLPSTLKPLQDNLSQIQALNASHEMLESMAMTVEKEGILDYEEDIEPAIEKFVEGHPEATRNDIWEYFKDLNHQLTLERVKLGKKKEDREKSKEGLRSNVPGGKPPEKGGLRKIKPGENFSDFLTKTLDTAGVV